VLPSGNVVVKDPVSTLNTGKENYKEFWYALTGIAGESQNFDGNGQYVRFQPGGGLDTISLGAATLDPSTLFGQSAAPPVATAPVFSPKRPAYHPEVPCYKSGPTTSDEVNGPAARGKSDAVVGSQPSGTGAIGNLLDSVVCTLFTTLGLPCPTDGLLSATGGAAGAAAKGQAPAAPAVGGTRATGGSGTPSAPTAGGTGTSSAPATGGSTPSAGATTPSTSGTGPAGDGTPAPSASTGAAAPQSAPASSTGGLIGKLIGTLNPLKGIGR
jgi:hypothetical protein